MTTRKMSDFSPEGGATRPLLPPAEEEVGAEDEAEEEPFLPFLPAEASAAAAAAAESSRQATALANAASLNAPFSSTARKRPSPPAGKTYICKGVGRYSV